MNKTITAIWKKTIIAALSAAFVATLLVPAMTANQPMNMTNPRMSASTTKHHHKRHHKVEHAHRAKPGNRSQSTLERGVGTSAGKASKFTKRTLTVPQKNPRASHKPGDRSQSTLERGLGTSQHKAGKFVKKTFTAPHKTPPANGNQ